MSKLIDLNQLTIYSNRLWAKMKDSFVTRRELADGRLILENLYLKGGLLSSINNTNAAYVMGNDTSYSAAASLRVSSGEILGKVVIAVANSYNVGDTITGVNIGAVKVSNNQVLDYLKSNETARVVENIYPQITASKIIEIEFEKTWNEDVYILVGAKGMQWGMRPNGSSIVSAGGSTLPQVGSTLNLNPGNYIGKVILFAKYRRLNSIVNHINPEEYRTSTRESDIIEDLIISDTADLTTADIERENTNIFRTMINKFTKGADHGADNNRIN